MSLYTVGILINSMKPPIIDLENYDMIKWMKHLCIKY